MNTTVSSTISGWLCSALVPLAFPLLAAAATDLDPPLERTVRATLDQALAPVVAARGATVTIRVDRPEARRELAPCARMAGFLPPGARLGGRTLVGVRCLEGATWQTFVSAEVHVEAAIWQATRALRAGDPLAPGDVIAAAAVLSPGDLETVSSRVPAATSRTYATLDGRSAAPLGRTLQRPVAPGRPLVAADLRDEGRVNPGDPVRVVYNGDGFSISSDGRSVGAADPGANILIRLASGALVNGTLLNDHRVELAR